MRLPRLRITVRGIMVAAAVVVAAIIEYRALLGSHYRLVDADGIAWGPIRREPYAVEIALLLPAIFLLAALLWVMRKLLSSNF